MDDAIVPGLFQISDQILCQLLNQIGVGRLFIFSNLRKTLIKKLVNHEILMFSLFLSYCYKPHNMKIYDFRDIFILVMIK